MHACAEKSLVRDAPLLSWSDSLNAILHLVTINGGGDTQPPLPGVCNDAFARLPASMGTGSCKSVQFSPSLTLFTQNATLNTSFYARFLGEGLLKFHFRLTGSSKIALEDGVAHQLDGPLFQVFYHAIGVNDAEWVYAAPTRGWVSICCRPSILRDELGFDRDTLPLWLARCVYGEQACAHIANGQLQEDMAAAVSAISTTDGIRGPQKQYLQAKCVELIYLTVMSLSRSTAQEELAYRFSNRDRRALEQARLIIRDKIDANLTIADLCDAVGINRNKLTQGFRHLHGKTPNRFIVDALMAEAQRRLRLSAESVEQISYRLGYDHPNNFSTAFRREVGISPSDFRRSHNAQLVSPGPVVSSVAAI